MSLTRDKIFWDAFVAHANATVEATGLLRKMFDNLDEADRYAKEISTIENRGDKITHDTVLALHQTWITPLDREEIHSLISKLDDVLDYVEAASERVALYEMRESINEAGELARVLETSAQEVARAVAALSNIKDAKPLLEMCVTINKLENEADTIFRKGLARLFKNSGDPLAVMKWRDILESMETATDRAEDVANIIEGIVLEHA